MEFKLKILAIFGTVALATWMYADYADDEALRDVIGNKVEPFIIVADDPYADAGEEETKNSVRPVVASEPKNLSETKPEFSNIKLIPQDPIFATPAPFEPGQTPQHHAPVRLPDALVGAIVGDEDGLQKLQKFFDASTGQGEDITRKTSDLLNALEDTPLASDTQAARAAAERVIDAAARAATSAYTFPYTSPSEFGLYRDEKGWDLGPDDKIPHRGFIRIGPSSNFVRGAGMVALEASPENDFLKDGIVNVARFDTPDIDPGEYRLYVITSPLPSGHRLSYPFGRKFGFNGNEIRIVDASSSSHTKWATLTSSGIDLENDDQSENNERALTPIGGQSEDPPDGWLLTTLIRTDGEPLQLEFKQGLAEKTYIVGIIISPADIDKMQNDLNDRLMAFLDNIAPAGGRLAEGYGNDYTAKTFRDFFNFPNTRSALGPDAGPLTRFGNPQSTPNGDPDDGGTDDGGTDDGGTDDGGTDDGGTDDGGTDDGGTDDGGTDDGGTDDGGTDDGGTDDGGTDDGGTDDGGTDDGGTDDGGTDDGGTDDGGTDDGGTDDGGTDDGGTDDGGTDDGGTDDGGTDDGGTDDGGTDDGGTDDGGTDDGGTDDGGTDDGGTDDGGTDDGGTDDGGTDDGGTDDGGTDDGGTDDGGTDDGGTDDGGTDDGGTDDGGTDDGGTDDGGTDGSPILDADAGPDETIYVGEDFNLDGCFSTLVEISLCDIQAELSEEEFDELFDIKWLVGGDELVGSDLTMANVIADNPSIFPGIGDYIVELVIIWTGEGFEYDRQPLNNEIWLIASDEMTLHIVSAPGALGLIILGYGLVIRRRRRNNRDS